MKLKKSIAIIISVVMIFASLSSLATAASVSDITGHWSEEFVQPLVEKGIIKGYEDGTFKPDNSISRAEFCTIISKALVEIGIIDSLVEPKGVFKDVAKDAWYAEFVETAAEYKFVGGVGNEMFDPEANITRQEMAKIISLVYCEINPASEGDKFTQLKEACNLDDYNLTDLNTADAWAKDYIKVALKAEVMKGDGSKFTPLGQVTRAETATVTSRIMVVPTPTGTGEAIVPTATVEVTLKPTPAPIRSHGDKLTFSSMILVNYPTYIHNDIPMSVLTDGIANDTKGAYTCEYSKPEYLFDLGSVKEIQSFAISGYNSKTQAVFFKLLISKDQESWATIGTEVDLKISQPIIGNPADYKKNAFDLETGAIGPAPTKFDTATTNETFTIGNYALRSVKETADGSDIDVECFSIPQMDTTIENIDWASYGYVDAYCNYMFHYFMDDVQSAQYIKIIGYGNSSGYYMWSSFTEVQVFGPDKPIAE